MIVVKNSENPVELPLGKISGCKLLVVFCTDIHYVREHDGGRCKNLVSDGTVSTSRKGSR